MDEVSSPLVTRRRYLGGLVGIGVAGLATVVASRLPSALAQSGLTWRTPIDGSKVGGVLALQVDPPRGTTRVLYYVKGQWVGTVDSAPWTLELDTTQYKDGRYKLRANARDDDSGHLLDRADISVTFDQSVVDGSQPPEDQDNEKSEPDPAPDTIEWLTPKDGEEINGSVTLEVQPPGGTTRVLYYAIGDFVGAARSAPWKVELDTSAYPDGDLWLRANARDDNAGVLLDRQDITAIVARQHKEEPDDERLEEPEEDDDAPDEDDREDESEDDESVSGKACPNWVHASYEGAWHPAVDPRSGCWIGHEHGDNPDPDGHFAAAGVEATNLNHLLEIYEVHLASHGRGLKDSPWATEQYKVQYLDTGDRNTLGRHQFVNVNNNALAAWGEPNLIKDRSSSYEWASYIPVRANMLGPNGTYIDFRWVCKIADVHNRGSAVSPFDKEDFIELHQEDPAAAREFLSGGNRGIAFYVTPFTSDRKRGHHFAQVDGSDLFRYAFFYRTMDSSVYSTGTMENAYAADDPYAEGNWHLGSLRWTSRMGMGTFVQPGTYWTDIYGEKLLGTGPNRPNTKEYAVKQVIGFRSRMRHYVHESNPGAALLSPTVARLYDAPGLRYPQ